jgi:hypothetical protein
MLFVRYELILPRRTAPVFVDGLHCRIRAREHSVCKDCDAIMVMKDRRRVRTFWSGRDPAPCPCVEADSAAVRLGVALVLTSCTFELNSRSRHVAISCSDACRERIREDTFMRCDCFSQHPHGAKGHILPMPLVRLWLRALTAFHLPREGWY